MFHPYSKLLPSRWGTVPRLMRALSMRVRDFRPLVVLLVVALATPSVLWGQRVSRSAEAASSLSTAERKAVSRVRLDTLREITRTLASEEMQGRGTASPGGEKAAKYIAARFARLKLKPLGDEGTYLQSIKFKTSEVLPESSVKLNGDQLTYGEDFVVAPPVTSKRGEAVGELVFVGYGVVSTDLKRDDFAGLDLRGKIAILLRGQPENVDESAWRAAAGRQAVLNNLLARGAIGLVVTNVGTKDQPYSLLAKYLTRRNVSLANASALPLKLPPILLVSDEAAEKLFTEAGASFPQIKKRAERGDFVSRPLDKTATLAVRVRDEVAVGHNVVGALEGYDSALKQEAVAYSAHYDAFGVDADGRVYAGAADNALGVGTMMAIAAAFAASRERPRRSVLFLAFTGEEYGLLGAEHWVDHPTWPLGKLAADINFDGIGTETYGPVKSVVGFGAEYSDLGDLLKEVAVAAGTTVIPDPLPEERAFYRSDHFAFVKKGVPAIMLLGAPYGDMAVLTARARKWLATDYHQTSDVVREDWNWEGPRTMAVVGLVLGLRIANAATWPEWKSSAPYRRWTMTGDTVAPKM